MASNEVPVNLDARKLMQESGNTLTVRCKLKGEWKLRLGLLLVRLGAWVAGIGFEVTEDE